MLRLGCSVPLATGCVAPSPLVQRRGRSKEILDGSLVQSLPFATVGDATVAYRATTSLLAGDGGTALTVDAVRFQRTKLVSIVSVNPNRPLDITIVVEAANLMARRAAG